MFHHVTSVANLLQAWREFRRGKRKKPDVAQFELELEENIFTLHDELVQRRYRHAPYTDFVVCDPKRRHIHKACVRDRVVQQALFRVLYPLFDKHFISDSFSSRMGKGTHLGVACLERAMRKVTKNWRVSAYALKCDVRKFFDSIDHSLLKSLLYREVSDRETQALLEIILESFEKTPGKGLPLGNVTSQLFANIYMNELDQYAKHVLKCRYYFRYCDDFVILGRDQESLEDLLQKITLFLRQRLSLELHPNKVEIRKVRQGIDFLGYVVFPHHRRLRTKTKRRIMKRMKEKGADHEKLEQLVSYQGVAGHAREYLLTQEIIALKALLGDPCKKDSSLL